jgi:hypothetical protein
MKFITIVTLLSLPLWAPRIEHSKVGRSAATEAPRRAVVLELFTSEGCSSCPPADALLARLEEQQPVAGIEIVALEEHVDYWDHQGWVDPFSSGQWTLRQQSYAAALSDHGVYTPELVVDGHIGFVGSHETEARRAIAAAQSQPAANIQLEPAKSEKRDHPSFKVTIASMQNPQAGDTVEVWLAITERGLHSAVTRGENAGEDLHHAPVVRWLHKVGAVDRNAPPAFSSQVEAKLDSNWNRANLRAVAFVQEKRTRHILGAATVRIEP